MSRMEVKLNDLPDLPLEMILLSYLSLQERIKARAVCRRWCKMIDGFKVRSLCFSDRSSGHVRGKGRTASDAFAQNFISSPRIEPFFRTFGRSILSSLKRFCLCDLDLNAKKLSALARILNAFVQLEQLGFFGFHHLGVLKLNLPMLNGIQLGCLYGTEGALILDAPRLQKVKLVDCSLSVQLVRGESVERLDIWDLTRIEVKKLKNLKHLYILSPFCEIDSTLLASLKQLREIHLLNPNDISELFEQKRLHELADLKIYLGGLLLSGPDDSTMNPRIGYLTFETFLYLMENRTKLAKEIPYYSHLSFSTVELLVPEPTISILDRLTSLNKIDVDKPVQDIERFLDFLINRKHIVELEFRCEQPQNLFDRLPDHCAVQSLIIRCTVEDFGFLFRLQYLLDLQISFSIDVESIRTLFETLNYLLRFEHSGKNDQVEISRPKQFAVRTDQNRTNLPDLNATIEYLIANTPERKRKPVNRHQVKSRKTSLLFHYVE